MNMDISKVKKIILTSVPYCIFGYIGDVAGMAYRTTNGNGIMKLSPFLNNFIEALAAFKLSFVPYDIFWGICTAVIMRAVLYYKAKNRKKFRHGEEYGSARWGTSKDIEPFIDKTDFSNNLLLSKTERLTMGKPSAPKYARNKNVEIIGGSGAGKTRGVIKPNIMQMNCSYIVTDPKGLVLKECGKMLLRGRQIKKDVYEPYRIKVFNTIDFSEGMHYNPFAYISSSNRERDIMKFVDVLIKNTKTKNSTGDDFWEKAEKLLYMAYIAMIFCVFPEEEQNFATLIDMINGSECREDQEDFMNAIDVLFFHVELWITLAFDEFQEIAEDDFKTYFCEPPDEERIRIGSFAIKQYKSYKLAAGKTAKSILISCSTRLAPFAIDEVLEITSYDELGLDKLGDELSALFVIISDTDSSFNFLVAIMYSQLFNLLCTKADKSKGGRLKYPVQCLLDEFANIGEIPNFDKLIATIRSRGISVCIVLQSKSQLKSIYKDNVETIEDCCDSTIFLGGKGKSTLKDISEILGKETIDMFNTSQNRGQSETYGTNYQKLGKELKTQDELAIMDGDKCIVIVRGVRPFFSDKFDITRHKNYHLLSDEHPENEFDVKKFVQERSAHRAKMKGDTVVEQFAISLENMK